MTLTQISTAGVKDDAVTSGKIPANAVGSSEIADQAVTLAKLEHGTSSNNGKFLRANNGADPSFETVTSTTINNNANNRIITGSDTADTLNSESALTFNNSTDTLQIHQTDTGNNPAFKSIHRGSAGSNINAHFTNYSGTNHTVILHDGSVGIGTTSPDSKLHVSADSATAQLRLTRSNAAGNTNDYGRILWESQDDVLTGQIAVARQSAENNGYMHFSTASGGTLSERMRIDSSGNVGIGKTSPVAKLELDTSHYVPTSSGRSTTGIHLDGTWGNAGEYGGGISFACGQTGSAAIAARQATSDGDVVGLSFFTHDSATGSADAVEKVRIHDGGAVSFNNGVCLGNGLTLSNANTLDDYEEGTFTSLLNGGNFTASQGYNRYVKVGNVVHVSGRLASFSSTTNTTDIAITLPFTCIDIDSVWCGNSVWNQPGESQMSNGVTPRALEGSSNMQFLVQGNGSGGTWFWLEYNHLHGSNTGCHYHVTYHTA